MGRPPATYLRVLAALLGTLVLVAGCASVSPDRITADRFTRSMLNPIPPAAVFQMLQAGWAAELVMTTVLNSINGLRNDSYGAVGDPGSLAGTRTYVE